MEEGEKKKGKKKGGMKLRAREDGAVQPTDVALHPGCVAAKVCVPAASFFLTDLACFSLFCARAQTPTP